MKEIEFRVWNKKDKSMHIVISLHHPRYLDCCEYAVGQSSGDVRSVQYKDCKIMQFIGIKDKNKKKIYEGDIVEVQFKTHKERVEIQNTGSWFSGSGLANTDWEVIGNIYENKKLLKGGLMKKNEKSTNTNTRTATSVQ